MSAPELVFIGDVHLERDDPHLDDFVGFLQGLADPPRRVVLLGDLFNVWIGQRELEGPHQRRVVDTLAALRRAGCTVRFVEGNRDYRIGPAYEGFAFDEAGLDGVAERLGDRRIRAIHGDLANPADRRYRMWRAVSRSRAVWGAFGLLPRSRRVALVEALERRMRASNREFKRGFPEARVRAYGESFLRRGFDAVVLGHFHVERRLELPEGEVFVLPEWRESRRHLESDASGALRFVDSNVG